MRKDGETEGRNEGRREGRASSLEGRPTREGMRQQGVSCHEHKKVAGTRERARVDDGECGKGEGNGDSAMETVEARRRQARGTQEAVDGEDIKER